VRIENTAEDNKIKLDDDTFEKLFKDLYPVLCKFCIRFVRKAEIAEEIVQEQFINLWKKKDELNIHTSLKSYIYTAVKNRSIDYLRSKFSKLVFVPEEFSHGLVENSDPQKLLEEKEISFIVTEAVNELPEKCYMVFSLSRFADLSNREIAEKLNISEKTVENQITIAIRKIKAHIKNHLR
jgi:RNA polymerase sigma-70 factor, ECF subfamily